MSEVVTGTIVNIVHVRNCVFIRRAVPGQAPKDYFAHKSALQSPLAIENVKDGQQVQFIPTEGTKGPRAEQVEIFDVETEQ